MIKLLPNEKVTFEHFTPKEQMQDFQDYAWWVVIKGIKVSVIKFTPKFYSGDYEIWSDEKLFEDVERFATMVDLLKRLTELNSKEQNNAK